jgi:di/tricarboxylate transporter
MTPEESESFIIRAKVGLASLIINTFILELIPFIFVKSFGCADYLASEDRENMMRGTKWFIRLLAFCFSVLAGYFMFRNNIDIFYSYVAFAVFVFIFLTFFGIPVEKFLIFKTDSLKERCKNFKPKYKLSDN